MNPLPSVRLCDGYVFGLAPEKRPKNTSLYRAGETAVTRGRERESARATPAEKCRRCERGVVDPSRPSDRVVTVLSKSLGILTACGGTVAELALLVKRYQWASTRTYSDTHSRSQLLRDSRESHPTGWAAFG